LTRSKSALLASVCVVALSSYGIPNFFEALAFAPPRVLKGHEDAVTSIDVSRNGDLIATASLDRTVRLWDARTGKPSRVLRGHQDEVYMVAFSPNGERLSSSSYDGRVLVWDVASGKVLRTLTVADWSTTLDFSADGRQLAVGSQNRNVTIFDVRTGNVLRTLETKNSVYEVAFSPNGRYLAVGYRSIDVWDLQTNQIAKSLRQTGVTSIAFSPDSQLIAAGSGDKSVRIWKVETGEQLKKLETDTPLVWQLPSGDQSVRSKMPVTSVSFSPDGKLLAMGTGRAVHLWDVSTGNQVRTLEAHTKSVTDVAFLRDGNSLASSSLDGTARIWSLNQQ
jgi:WD40 repeat protein